MTNIKTFLLALLCVVLLPDYVFAGTTVKTWKNPALKIEKVDKYSFFLSGMIYGRDFHFSRKMSCQKILSNGLWKA